MKNFNKTKLENTILRCGQKYSKADKRKRKIVGAYMNPAPRKTIF